MARFSLRHIGASHLPDFETVFGRLQLLSQHGHVVLAQADDSFITYNIDIRGHGIE